jgi:hypothetical protein
VNEIPAPAGGVARQKYRWPWFLAAAVLLGLVLAVLWMSVAIERARRMRHLDAPPGNVDPTRASSHEMFSA